MGEEAVSHDSLLYHDEVADHAEHYAVGTRTRKIAPSPFCHSSSA
jgi:hypothetical protein